MIHVRENGRLLVRSLSLMQTVSSRIECKKRSFWTCFGQPITASGIDLSLVLKAFKTTVFFFNSLRGCP